MNRYYDDHIAREVFFDQGPYETPIRLTGGDHWYADDAELLAAAEQRARSIWPIVDEDRPLNVHLGEMLATDLRDSLRIVSVPGF